MPKKVLIVDDEPNIVLPLEYLMKKQGYEVHCAGDGEAALEAIRAHAPDLVLLDINMPKLNGYQVCESIRADSGCSAMKVIMLTAKGRDVERDKGMALGADDYITKPFSTQHVANKVAELLG